MIVPTVKPSNGSLRDIVQDVADAYAKKASLDRVLISEATLSAEQLRMPSIETAPSAFHVWLGALFQDVSGFSPEKHHATTEGSARWSIQQESAGSTLALIQHLSKHGHSEEARLCAVQSQIIPDFRKGVVQERDRFHDAQVGKELFGKIKLKGEKMLNASSSAAAVEKLLPLLDDPVPIEALFAAETGLFFMTEAVSEVSGKRLDKLVALLRNAPEVLVKHRHPAVRSYAALYQSELERLRACGLIH